MAQAGACIAIGIDLAAGRGLTAMAVLSAARLSAGERARGSLPALSLLSLSCPQDDAAILAAVAAIAADAEGTAERPSVVIGLDAPLTLPAPVAFALRGAAPSAAGSRYTRAAERDPVWSQLGVRPLPVSFLGGLTFRAIPLAVQLSALAPEVSVIEVFPSAAFLALELLRAAPRRAVGAAAERENIRSKTSSVRRRAAQTSLANYISGVPRPDPNEEPLRADPLDALAAAMTAAAYLLDSAQAVGDPSEGCITLPARPARDLFAPAPA